MTDKSRTKHPPLVLRKSASGHGLYPLMWDSLPEGYQQYARDVLNETEENQRNGICKLKEFIKSENLACPDDSHLIMVLRCCKYNIEKSKTKLKRYMNTRQLIISRIAGIDMEKIKLIVDDMFFVFMPYRDRYGRLIGYTRGYARADKYRLEDAGYIALASALFVLSHPMTQVYGACFIPSSTCDSFMLFYKLAKIYKKITQKLLDMPFRIGRIDVVNEFILTRWLASLVRPMLPEKVKNRLHFHGSSYEELLAAYHPEVLPEDAGGKWTPMNNKHYREELLDFIKRLRDEDR